jgi:hypothetical protein
MAGAGGRGVREEEEEEEEEGHVKEGFADCAHW